MAKTTTARPKLTRAEINRYFELECERLELARKAKDLAALQEKIEQRMIAAVRANGGKERTLITCGYRLAISMVRVGVKWKDEFVRAMGEDKAEQLVEAQPKKEKFTVEPAK